ncbi:MAG TPA: aldo/keto reductase [Acidimicrobiales bacterium]|jgi:aryl-alcohol dehydrogenase-like predicted oxidoreductase|nr:aldo/keto reductase [Acidimicrobiales bacterium]
MSTNVAQASGTFSLGGSRSVTRLGFGSMQLTGRGTWGEPKDPDEAVRVLQKAVELGVDFIDTADSYGPFTAELLIKKALHPYPEGLTVATKAGLTRSGPFQWHPVGRPEYLRQQCELSLRHLGVPRIELFQLHRIDAKVPLEDQVGELAKLRDEGKIGLIGLSEIEVSDLDAASKITEIASVQNLYNLSNRQAEKLLDVCEERGIGFIPWFPLDTGKLAKPGSPLADIATRLDATPSQVALAWLLKRSPVMLPIPGTSKVAHLEENMAGAQLQLSDDDFQALSDLA